MIRHVGTESLEKPLFARNAHAILNCLIGHTQNLSDGAAHLNPDCQPYYIQTGHYKVDRLSRLIQPKIVVGCLAL